MGAPVSGLEAGEQVSAEGLLSALRSVPAGDLRKHASLVNYWFAIRRGRELPAIRDLDPLEISDAGPSSVLLELIDGGDDAEIRHVGETLKTTAEISRLSDAATPSALSCIAGKLSIVAISRNALAFQDRMDVTDGPTRCSVTLLPFSSTGTTVDFVYGFVSLDAGEPEVDEAAEIDPTSIVEGIASEPEILAEEPEAASYDAPAAPASDAEEVPAGVDQLPQPAPVEPGPQADPDSAQQQTEPFGESPELAAPPPAGAEAKPGFAKIFDALAGAKGFFGTVAAAEPGPVPKSAAEEASPVIDEAGPVSAEQPIADEPAAVVEDVAEEPPPAGEDVAEEPPAAVVDVAEDAPTEADDVAEETPSVADDPAPTIENEIETPHYAVEGTLEMKLTEVRSKADEARAARLRSEALLLEGLSAAYDFALDAEDAPEEYLKLVEAQGLKIQLRSPMKPVVKLAFDGYCDEGTIKQLEAVLAWALKLDLPRGSLAERIESEGGVAAVLNGQKRAA